MSCDEISDPEKNVHSIVCSLFNKDVYSMLDCIEILEKLEHITFDEYHHPKDLIEWLKKQDYVESINEPIYKMTNRDSFKIKKYDVFILKKDKLNDILNIYFRVKEVYDES